jgi:hypothetical protein
VVAEFEPSKWRENSYLFRTNLVKDKNGDLYADSHNILNRFKNNVCQLLNARGFNGVWQPEMHAAEPLVPESCSFVVEVLPKC